MAGPSAAPCPWCQAPPGALFVSTVLETLPLGTWSLSGQQLKPSAIELPVLVCRLCKRKLTGQYRTDKPGAQFPRTAPPETISQELLEDLERRGIEE